MHTRRYHGLLVVADSPVQRSVLLSRLDETVVVGGRRSELSCNRFPGALHPEGWRFLRSFERGLFPSFSYEVDGIRLRKTVACPWGENTTLVLYEVVEAPGPFTLELRAFVAARGYHALRHEDPGFTPEVEHVDGTLWIQPPGGGPFAIHARGSEWRPDVDWYRRFEYSVERYRGLEFQEDLWTPGVLRRTLSPGERFGIVASTDSRRRDPFALLRAERRRREGLVEAVPDDPFARRLALAADQFLVRRGDDLRTVIAGYHWFGDWGRDTMIALPGLCLATGRLEDARRILAAFAASVSRGQLPNRFTDDDGAPEYNTVDASLWFFVAVHEYLRAGGDEVWVLETLLPVLRDMVGWHERGTRFGIRVADDGLLVAGEPGVQLTWMDAKVGDWVVTPRRGKAVEINALWYNTLLVLAELERRGGDSAASDRLEARSVAVRERFEALFWNGEAGCLYDVVDDSGADPAIRPNQVFSLSLPYPLLTGERAEAVLAVVESRLLTPLGLRSLDPADPAYRPTYGGDMWSRDGAYHQGTVWGWLLGPWVTALVRCRGEKGRRQARRLLESASRHLDEAGVGSYSEIFDAEPPHAPRGCIAQAWSVAELLRCYLQDVLRAYGAEREEASLEEPAR
jgi:predicted glycogen debranching enzyme